MNDVSNIFQLDEANDRRREKQLYRNDYKFDSNRPIYQHPLDLAHFLTAESEVVFEQLFSLLEGTHPTQQIREKAAQYRQVQAEIDSLNEGEIEGLKQEVKKQIDNTKNDIEKSKALIEQTKMENNSLDEQNRTLQQQIKSIHKFISQSEYGKAKKGPAEVQQNEINLKQKAQSIEKTVKSELKQFESSYASLLKRKQMLTELQKQLSFMQVQERQALKQNEVLRRQNIELQIQVDSIEAEVKVEQQKYDKIVSAHAYELSDIPDVGQQSLSSEQKSQQNSSSSSKSNLISQSKTVYDFKKQESKIEKYFFVFLIVASACLACWTWFQD